MKNKYLDFEKILYCKKNEIYECLNLIDEYIHLSFANNESFVLNVPNQIENIKFFFNSGIYLSYSYETNISDSIYYKKYFNEYFRIKKLERILYEK